MGVRVDFIAPRHLFLASVRKACSALKPVRSVRVCTMCVHLRKAVQHQVSAFSFAHCRDSYKRVKSRSRIRTAFAARSPTMEF